MPLKSNYLFLILEFLQNKRKTNKTIAFAVAMTLFDTEQRKLDSVSFKSSGQYLCIVTNRQVNRSQRVFITSSVHLIAKAELTLSELVSRHEE